MFEMKLFFFAVIKKKLFLICYDIHITKYRVPGLELHREGKPLIAGHLLFDPHQVLFELFALLYCLCEGEQLRLASRCRSYARASYAGCYGYHNYSSSKLDLLNYMLISRRLAKNFWATNQEFLGVDLLLLHGNCSF